MIQSASHDEAPVTKTEFNQAMGFVNGQFSEIQEQFRRVGERFQEVDRRFEQVDRRFEQVDRRFEQVDQRFEQVDRHFESIEGRLDALTEEVRENRTYSGILHEDMMHQFKLVLECLDPTRAQLEDHERRIRGLERDLPVLKDAVSTRR